MRRELGDGAAAPSPNSLLNRIILHDDRPRFSRIAEQPERIMQDFRLKLGLIRLTERGTGLVRFRVERTWRSGGFRLVWRNGNEDR